ncbi:MAG TPA: hypothetical protein VGK63_07670 [Candidatus Limnocylindrales bacterium]
MTRPPTEALVINRQFVLLYVFAGLVLGLLASLMSALVAGMGLLGLAGLLIYRLAIAAFVARSVAPVARLTTFRWLVARDLVMFPVGVAVVALGLAPRTAAVLLSALTVALAFGLIAWAIRVFMRRDGRTR